MEILKSSLFTGITGDEYGRMMTCFSASERAYRAGQTILEYGHGSGMFGVVQTGLACLVRSDKDGSRTVLEYLEPGSVFGEMVAFSVAAGDSLWVECEQDCQIIFIPEDQLSKRCENACLHHSKLVENLFEIMRKKAMALSERVEVLSRRTIRERLISYFALCSFREKSGVIRLPFSYSALAGYICADRSALMREMKKMSEENLITKNKRTIVLGPAFPGGGQDGANHDFS